MDNQNAILHCAIHVDAKLCESYKAVCVNDNDSCAIYPSKYTND